MGCAGGPPHGCDDGYVSESKKEFTSENRIHDRKKERTKCKKELFVCKTIEKNKEKQKEIRRKTIKKSIRNKQRKEDRKTMQ